MANDQRLICPKCAKKFVVSKENQAYRPFCSKRCKMVDLGQWLGEKYVVEGTEAHENEKTKNNDHEE